MTRRHYVSLFLTLVLLPFALFSSCEKLAPERQAYVVCMGLDVEADGRVTLSVQIPENAQGEQQGAQGAKPSATKGYSLFSVTADSFSDCYHLLASVIPYPLHFGQLRLCVLGEEKAAQSDLEKLVRDLIKLPAVRRTMILAVAKGKAQALISAQAPDFGMRLSKHIDMTFQSLKMLGLSPATTLADCVRWLGGGRADPLLTLCAVNQKLQKQNEQNQGGGGDGGDSPEGGNAAAFAVAREPISYDESAQGMGELLPDDVRSGEMERKGENPVEMFGAVVLSGVRVAGTLSVRETQVYSIARGEGRLRVLRAGERLRLQLILPGEHAALVPEAEALLRKLQALGSDAFGFGAAAATGFSTLGEWERYDFVKRYPMAEVDVATE